MERKTAQRNPGASKRRVIAPMGQNGPAAEFLALAQHALKEHYFPRVAACFRELSEDDIWWRPNAASNSAGNLALHLAGNARQWIISGLGGAQDVRKRDEEFQEQGPIAGKILVAHLQKQVRAACGVISRFTPGDLKREYTIQNLRVSGMNAIQHVVEHFAYHTGQIIYLTKLRRGDDLGFTRLPDEKKTKRPRLPVL